MTYSSETGTVQDLGKKKGGISFKELLSVEKKKKKKEMSLGQDWHFIDFLLTSIFLGNFNRLVSIFSIWNKLLEFLKAKMEGKCFHFFQNNNFKLSKKLQFMKRKKREKEKENQNFCFCVKLVWSCEIFFLFWIPNLKWI